MRSARRTRCRLLVLAAAAALVLVSCGLQTFVGAVPRATSRVVRAAEANKSEQFIEITEESTVVAAGVVSGMAGLLLGGVWIAVPLFALSACVTRRPNDDLAVAGRGVANASLEALNFVHMLDKKYSLSDTLGIKIAEAVRSYPNTDRAAGFVRSAANVILTFDKDFGILKTLGGMVLSAGNLASGLVEKLVEPIDRRKLVEELRAKLDEATKSLLETRLTVAKLEEELKMASHELHQVGSNAEEHWQLVYDHAERNAALESEVRKLWKELEDAQFEGAVAKDNVTLLRDEVRLHKESLELAIAREGALSEKLQAPGLEHIQRPVVGPLPLGGHQRENKLTEVQPQSAEHGLGSIEKPVHEVQTSPRRRSPSGRPSKSCGRILLDFADLLVAEPLSEHYAAQLGPCVESVCNGGVGILPTGSQHAMVCSMASKRSIQSLYELTGPEESSTTPLSLLCSDFTMAARYLDVQSVPRQWYVLMKNCLPGPFVFIVKGTKNIPKAIFDSKLHRKHWKCREIGLEIPASGVAQRLISDLGEPLLASSLGAKERKLSFMVAGGQLEAAWSIRQPSTVIDLTLQVPVIRREGEGDPAQFLGEARERGW